MFVTAHALNRLHDRLAGSDMYNALDTLEALDGEAGTIAYVIGRLRGKVAAPDGSNGEVVVAVAVDGSVETVYYRRATQDMSARFFGARKVVDLHRFILKGGAA